MIDSSGQPNDGFLWGNLLWVGRQSECDAAQRHKPLLIDPRSSNFRPYVSSDFTPFKVNFFSVFARHNSELQQHTNLLKDEVSTLIIA